MENQLLKRSRVLADRFLEFVNQSPSPFHVVEWFRNCLTKGGYEELQETASWKIQKGKKYFFTRNNSTIVAFNVGEQFDPKDTGFKIIGAHTDSPCLKIAPVSKANFKSYAQSHVMTYGGGLWHTWFDRDLILAGKVVYNDGKQYTSKLWRSKRPLLKIPNLAIHLRTDRNKFDPNPQTELRPILSSQYHQQLAQKVIKEEANIFNKHNTRLVNIICEDLGISSDSIVDFDLYFADSNPSSYVGLDEDFISSPRLDNLFSSFHAIQSLIATQNKGSHINMAALFDHEECGSSSAQGAGSPIVINAVKRIYNNICPNGIDNDNYFKTLQKSYVISADMAHSIHPNYADKHQVNHQAEMNKGVVIKLNYNQRYATDLVSSSIFKILAKEANVPLQQIIVKNDSPCGSTIGPIIASGTGMKTIDIGTAMLGMHSIRETCGVIDGVYYHDLFQQFYKNYESIPHDLLDK